MKARLTGFFVSPPKPQKGQPAVDAPARKTEYLSSIDIFHDLLPEEIAQVERMTRMTTATRGHLLYVPDKTGQLLFLLKKGHVQIYRLSPDGRKLIVAVLGPETFFGEMPLLGQDMSSNFAEALEDVTLCVMTRDDIEALVLRKPQVALRILDVLGRRLTEREDQLEEAAFKRVPARLAALLLRLADGDGQREVVLSHQEMAEMLGVYRETVTLALDQLKDLGAVETGRRRVTIVDPELLRQTAEG